MDQQAKTLLTLFETDESFIYYLTKQNHFRVYYQKTDYQNIRPECYKQQVWLLLWKHIDSRYFKQISYEDSNKLNMLHQYLTVAEEKQKQTQCEQLYTYNESDIESIFQDSYRKRNNLDFSNLKKKILIKLMGGDIQPIGGEVQSVQIKTIEDLKQQARQILEYENEAITFNLQNNLKKHQIISQQLIKSIQKINKKINQPNSNALNAIQLFRNQSIIRKYCQIEILNTENNIIIQSIKHIQQLLGNICRITLESCFQVKQFFMKTNQIKSLIKSQRIFMKKKESFKNQKSILVEMCHHCQTTKNIIQMKRCSTKYKKQTKFNPTVITNPYFYLHYFKHVDIDYSRNYKFSYFNYRNEDNQLICNRFYCFSCLENYYLKTDMDKFICAYCIGSCQCSRCLLSDQLIKMKAIYVNNNGDLEKLENKSLIIKIFKQKSFKSEPQLKRERVKISTTLNKELMPCKLSINVGGMNHEQDFEKKLLKRIHLDQSRLN